MREYCTTEEFFGVCQSRGVVLDTNLLVLYIVGCRNSKNISSHPRLKKFDEGDFALVRWIVERSKNKSIYLTPQTIPETMFLLGHDPRTGEKDRSRDSYELLAATIENLKFANENIYTPTPEIFKNSEIWEIDQYGLPDLSFVDGIKKKDLAFLSDDSRLVAYMFSQDIAAKHYSECKSDVRVLQIG